jgi:hypothetical protein
MAFTVKLERTANSTFPIQQGFLTNLARTFASLPGVPKRSVNKFIIEN